MDTDHRNNRQWNSVGLYTTKKKNGNKKTTRILFDIIVREPSEV